MIYDELIEELALTLLTKARYEGCISVIDGFSQCEEDKTRIEYPVDAVMRIMLEMLASLNAMDKKKERLIEITADGQISSDEIDDFIRIRQELERISVTVETLQLWTERMLANGQIDAEAYKAKLSQP